MKRDPEVQQAASQFQLGLLRTPVAGRTGELLGRGTGASLEFQEYREYLPGDDLRHVDWAAYARSDALMVRLYREEISPRTEILVDASRSMATGEGTKAQLTRQLTMLFTHLSEQLGGRPRVFALTDDRPVIAWDSEAADHIAALNFEATATLPELLADHAIPLRPQAVRIVISDFLFPHDPDRLLRQLAAGASSLWIVQLLTAWEANPDEMGGRRIVDVETGDQIDLLINRKTVAAYKERLSLLQQSLIQGCRRYHARFAMLTADRGLLPLCRDELCASEMLRQV